MPYALVTGATAGIGAAFARLLAREGYDLVLVARDEQRLLAIAAEIRASVRVPSEILVADLSTSAGMKVVEDRLSDETRPVEVLVNNAGYALGKPFRETTTDEDQALLNVLVTAPLRLTHAVLPLMLTRGRGRLINIGSVAAYLPGSTYAAAKSWLSVFSESLHQQLAGTGVMVSVIAPGYTHTEFHERAGIDLSVVPEAMWLEAAHVAEQAWADVNRGKLVSIPGLQYRTLMTVVQYLPRPLVRNIAAFRPSPKGGAR
jgi:short-subunit dehydrogenase